MDNLLSIRNLCVDFHSNGRIVRAVNDISFDIPKGKTVGLVGESGSGKSVTSLAIMGLIPNPPGIVSNGEILFDKGDQTIDLLGLKADELRDIRGNDISMIFQEPMTSLNPVFTVGHQIAETLRLHKGLTSKEAAEQAIDLMNQVGIPSPKLKARSYPHELSGGQKQRVMIAMAMACDPKLLIADEPTTALDVTIQKQVLDLMFDLQDKHKMSILFITHDLAVIGDIADDVVVMYRSDLVEHGQAQELFRRPGHPYTKGLLACRPSLKGNPRRLLTVSDFMGDDGEEKKVLPHQLEVFDRSPEASKSESPLLQVKDMKTYFPIKGGFLQRTIGHVKAVDGVSFDLYRGQTLGLVGESGCGKTTLGRSILRLVEPTAGQVIYDGVDITSLTPVAMREMRSRMQIIFQDPYASLNPRMTIGDILMEPMVLHGIGQSKAERFRFAQELMSKVGLRPSQLGRYPHEFSGGQRQRVCIARALALKPEFIICDESVSALDVSIQAQILNLLLDLQEEMGLTYIFISHDLSVVSFFSDIVCVMNQGQLVEMGPSKEIYENAREPYTQTLLNAIPKGIEKSELVI